MPVEKPHEMIVYGVLDCFYTQVELYLKSNQYALAAKKLDFNNLSQFNPLEDAVVFSEKPIKLNIGKTPKFFLKGNWFGPFEQQEIELPEFAAVFLLARKSAKLKGIGKGEKDEA